MLRRSENSTLGVRSDSSFALSSRYREMFYYKTESLVSMSSGLSLMSEDVRPFSISEVPRKARLSVRAYACLRSSSRDVELMKLESLVTYLMTSAFDFTPCMFGW